jgi:uncharacterized protein (DUF488 family)
VKQVATIGVYEWDLDTFLAALAQAEVGLLIDVRQRRGVRGPQYAWANAVRLQNALARADISYRHEKRLAPTTELRHLQYAEDARLGVGKRSRRELAAQYSIRYTREILDRFPLGELVAELPEDAPTALMCVERDPEACHRSLVAQRLADQHGVAVRHLLPD